MGLLADASSLAPLPDTLDSKRCVVEGNAPGSSRLHYCNRRDVMTPIFYFITYEYGTSGETNKLRLMKGFLDGE